ncbi:hypothetical protein EST92_11675 [Streptomyces sp. TM32]|uniref:hypothetical protein n=1 Tax=Streptomyces sp. TM32 TaxID=1652669 RepID=UPI00101117B2|nr:hypothetical protein [Streptomyces sp. TM32]RXS84210.1 hypothetical protein EST92_11675 [Streptomyces sp. TM32]
MAEIAVGKGIVPAETTCCWGRPLELRSRGRVWDDDVWECPRCGCSLRTGLSDSVPRGQRIVIEIATADCSVGHSHEPDPGDPDAP